MVTWEESEANRKDKWRKYLALQGHRGVVREEAWSERREEVRRGMLTVVMDSGDDVYILLLLLLYFPCVSFFFVFSFSLHKDA